MKQDRLNRIEATFGAKSDELEEVRGWIEDAFGVAAEARESTHRGGDYYLFAADDGTNVFVMKNADLYDDEPVVDAGPEWKIVVSLEAAPAHSQWFLLLNSASAQFERISLTDY